ncbi:MAG TPA: hypothetical protein ENN76_03680, partial [Euryarchaeota archaeon]|nr:hypothetical protein [Euryarchaeota archaeon]
MSFFKSLKEIWDVMWSVTVMRVRILSRYKGWLAMDIIIPIIITLIPILLGRAAGGERAIAAFAENTGTDQYVAYLLIGSNVFAVVTNYLWFVGMWIRRERMTGTLESIYLTATHRMPLLLGT